MEDLKRLDSLTEFQLTNAIQKAASVALASDQDRSEILADHLKAANIPKHLTKLAACAFNRRLAVTTLGKRSEENKAQDFPLADLNKVASLMGCNEEEMSKTASVQEGFMFKVVKPEMKKAASAEKPAEKPFTMTPEKFLVKLESVVDKESAQFQKQMLELDADQKLLKKMVKRASQMLDRDVKTSRLLATVYGETFSNLFSGHVSEQALKKSAKYAILPKNPTVECVENTIKMADKVDVKRELLMTKSAQLDRFLQEVKEVKSKVTEACLNGTMKKEAGGYTLLKDIGANMMSVPLLGMMEGGRGLVNESQALLQQSAPFLAPQKGYSPEDVLSVGLLSKDRYKDKRMRIFDAFANPDFAKYPAAEIEKAVQDAIATNHELASPKMREFLKAQVNARLLAGNRVNRADLTASADLIKRLAEAQKAAKENTPEAAVKELSDVKYGGKGGISSILPDLAKATETGRGGPLFVKDLGKSIQGVRNSINATREAVQADKEKAREDRLKAVQKYMELRNKAIQANLAGATKSKAAKQLLGQNINLKNLDTRQKALLTAISSDWLSRHPEALQMLMNQTSK